MNASGILNVGQKFPDELAQLVRLLGQRPSRRSHLVGRRAGAVGRFGHAADIGRHLRYSGVRLGTLVGQRRVGFGKLFRLVEGGLVLRQVLGRCRAATVNRYLCLCKFRGRKCGSHIGP